MPPLQGEVATARLHQDLPPRERPVPGAVAQFRDVAQPQLGAGHAAVAGEATGLGAAVPFRRPGVAPQMSKKNTGEVYFGWFLFNFSGM